MPDPGRALRLVLWSAVPICTVAAVLAYFAVPSMPGWVAFAVAGLAAATAAGKAVSMLNESLRSAAAQQAEQSAAALASSKAETLAAVGEGMDIGLFRCDARGVVEYANPVAMELFRFDNPVGKALLAVTLSYDIESLVRDAIHSGEQRQEELSFAFPSDRTAIVNAWPGPEGDVAYVSIRETTELRKLERIRQDFVANVSHELRTPLASIRAMSETMIDEVGEGKTARPKYLEKIVEEVDRLALIANDLLVLSTAESNPVRKQVCDLAAISRAAVARIEHKAHEKGLRLTYEGPGGLTVQANIAQMSQVVTNLIDNAVNYTPGGFVKVVVYEDGDEAIFKVADSGIGIPSEELGRIFERFYRVDKGRSRVTGGTGLGLSIVKHIVEAHGGRVEVDSELNRGTTFRVYLPKG